MRQQTPRTSRQAIGDRPHRFPPRFKATTLLLFAALFACGAASAARAADSSGAGAGSSFLQMLLTGAGVWALWASLSLGLAYLFVRFADPALQSWIRARQDTLRFDIALCDPAGRWHEAGQFGAVRTMINFEGVDILVVGYGDSHIQLFNTRTGERIRRIEVPGSVNIGRLIVTPEFIVFTANGDREIRRIALKEVLETDRHRYLGVSLRDPGQISMVTALACHRDGNLLAAGDSQGCVSLYHLETGRLLGRIGPDPAVGERSAGEIASVAFHPTNSMIAISGGGGVNHVGRIGTLQWVVRSDAAVGNTLQRRTSREAELALAAPMDKFHSDPIERISQLVFSPRGDKLAYVLVNAGNEGGAFGRIVLRDISGNGPSRRPSKLLIEAPYATTVAFNAFNDREGSWNRIASNGSRPMVWKVDDDHIDAGARLTDDTADEVAANAVFVTFLRDPQRILTVGKLCASGRNGKRQLTSISLDGRGPEHTPEIRVVDAEESPSFAPAPVARAAAEPVAIVNDRLLAPVVPSNQEPEPEPEAEPARHEPRAPMPRRHIAVYSVFVLISILSTLLSLRSSHAPVGPVAAPPPFPDLAEKVKEIRSVAADAESDESLPNQKDAAAGEWKTVLTMAGKITPEKYPQWFRSAALDEKRSAPTNGGNPDQVSRPSSATVNDMGTLEYLKALACYHLKQRNAELSAVQRLNSYSTARITLPNGDVTPVRAAVESLPIVSAAPTGRGILAHRSKRGKTAGRASVPSARR